RSWGRLLEVLELNATHRASEDSPFTSLPLTYLGEALGGLGADAFRLVEIPRQNQLEGQFVGCVGEPKPNSRLYAQAFPVVICNGPQLVRLIPCSVELAQRSELVVLLGRDRPCVVEVVCDPRRRHEIKIPESVVRRIENRIDDDIDRLQVPPD